MRRNSTSWSAPPLQARDLATKAVEGAALISLSAVSKTYTTGSVSFTALDRVDLSVRAGEYVGVVGPSGSGKSTLLNLVTAIDRPTAGRVEVDGVLISILSADDAARWRGRNVGVVFQFFQLLPTLSLADNVALPMDLCGVHGRDERAEIARDLLARVGLAGHVDKLPSQVSGGQQQRAAIARALANDPPVLVADEPTGNLDSASAASMLALFDGLVESGRTVLLATHDATLAERSGRTVRLRDGTVTEDATGAR
ncbi:ABC transporter ATP-binding protein [Blastococcus sp. VKM Ac-2987]|uniref:ABC transporter ATP-binding protein n=1 Tax=Blastococcus sp. VKM Ac-2987 TaxID=3004141 RepID=UPI0022AB8141|nr:ABC transporter ATP-binding protein [Blastococcus sp. VKM Ac-2987]MCZ2857460.1 ABC transporter ATP-binding protein [Blastococcus sp. VKM Ac-2987]